MGFLDFLNPFKPKPTVEKSMLPSDRKSDTSVQLTELGKRKAEAFSLSGPKFDILSALLEEGSSTLGEISQKTGHPENKVREICKSLARSGYVKAIKV